MLFLRCGCDGKAAGQLVTVPFLRSCRYGAAEPHAVAAFMGGKGDTGRATPAEPAEPELCCLHYSGLSEQRLQSQAAVTEGTILPFIVQM